MGNDSGNRVPLTCRACGTEFHYAIPEGSPVPVPCPNCGAGVRAREPEPGDRTESGPTKAPETDATLQGVGSLDRLTPGPPKPYARDGSEPSDTDRSDTDENEATDRMHRPAIDAPDDEEADRTDPQDGADSETEPPESAGTDSSNSSATPNGLPTAETSGSELGDSDSAVEKLRRERRGSETGEEPAERADSGLEERVGYEEGTEEDEVALIRASLEDEQFNLRIEETVYAGIDADRLATLIAGGDILIVDAISTGEDDWMPPSKHPALSEVRRHTADNVRPLLQSESDVIDGEAGTSDPPSAPAEASTAAPDEPAEADDNDLAAEDASAAPDRPPEADDNDLAAEDASAAPDEPAEEDDNDLATQDAAAAPDRPPETDDDAPGPDAPAPDEPEESDPTSPGRDATPENEPEQSPSAPGAEESGARKPPESEGPESSDGSRSGAITTLLVGLVLLAAVGTALFATRDSTETDESARPTAEDRRTSERGAAHSAEQTPQADQSSKASVKIDVTVDRAREVIHRSASFDPTNRDVQRRTAEYLEANGHPTRASHVYDHVWRSGKSDRSFIDHYLNLLIKSDRYSQVRKVAIDALQRFDNRDRYESIYATSLDEDTRLGDYEVTNLAQRPDVGTIRPARDIGFDGLVVEGPEGRRRYLFAPAREGKQSWHDQVAAWRLCELIACPFDVAKTRAARISRPALKRLLETPSDAESPDLSAFEWQKSEKQAVTGTRQVVYGALRTWPTETVERWPIEATDIWRDWVSLHESIPREQSVQTAMKRAELPIDEAPYAQAAATTGDWPVERLAMQLSGILTFDYLTNNWDRFRPEENHYGMANHVGPDRFVTIRTETVFQPRGSRRVEGRFNWASRFSRDLVTSLHLLDRERTRSILYPRSNAVDRAKFEIFWRQRKRILNRVDFLVDRHGRDAVLAFE